MTIKLLERRAYAESLVKDPDLTSGLALRKGIIPLEIKAVADNVIRFIISDGSVDRDRDTINVQGWDLRNYLANPVVLWAHESHSAPIGKGSNIAIENEQLMSDAEFVGKDIMEFAHMVYQLYLGGFMNAVSVGFMPDERIWSDEQGGIKFLTQELLEFSAVPVPANANALQIARSAGGIDITPLKGWCENIIDTWEDGAEHSLGASRKAIERMFKASGKDTLIDIPAPTVDPEKQKELRQRNIWEPRLKEFREDHVWSRAWGEEMDVPVYIWDEHIVQEGIERDEKHAAVRAELAEVVNELAELKAAATDLDGVADVELVKELFKTYFEMDIDEDECKGIVEELRAYEKGEPVDKGEKRITNLLEELGFIANVSDDGLDNVVCIRSMAELLTSTEEARDLALASYSEVVEERDFLLEQLAETIANEESKQRVDPASMVRMFGESLGKHITKITGRLPD